MASRTSMINLDATPALAPPLGLVPNFVHPYSEARSIYITVGVCTGLVTPALIVRIFTKAYIIKRVNLEDCKYTVPKSGDISADKLKIF